MQIHPGHIVFEKRRPALVDSVFQSFVLAPFFVLFDVLFSLGYRPLLHKKLQVRLNM
ncbi:MAG: Mpo1-like protein [Bacteroidota bacterium]